MRVRTYASRFALAALALQLSGAAAAQGAKKPCALLRPAEVQTLNPAAPVGPGVAGSVPQLGTATCEFKWPHQAGATPDVRLEVMVTDAARMYPGLDAKLIAMGLLGGPRGLPSSTTVVPDVGDAATYKLNSSISSSLVAYVKGLMLQLEFESPDADKRKQQAIALLKAAASRL